VGLRGLLALGLLLLLTNILGCSDDNGKEPCEPVALYGPPPCNTDQDCVNWNGQGWVCDKGNTFDDGCGGTSNWPICVQSSQTDGGVKTDGCQPVALYGPQPCDTDQNCIDQHGSGWYCDKDNTFGDGCGGTTTWPICRQSSTPADAGVPAPDGPCQPAALYGPPPCNTDADCVSWYGEGWYCDTTNSYDDGCGNTVTWAMCKQK
jgi:hypothetical protein